ncbi:hypothetical protein [Arthrobacter sp. E3]|uniref:hypothetical protein n=1 Tax=Arthrobacter sp. E3 TaxID=517402 RepID=UPI001A93DE60|nr:hypothetical protein [Arthrobacter sp. E3]
MTNSLVLLLGRLAQVLDDYAVVSGEDRLDVSRLLISPCDSSEQFVFMDTPAQIVDHVLAFEHVPLWDPKVDTEDDGRWRLFAAHIKEAIETADTNQRMLVLVEGGVSARRTA